MGSRGRKSVAQLIVANGVETMRRPVPLDELTDEQAAEWRAVVGRMPSDWFARETYPFLGPLLPACGHGASHPSADRGAAD